MDPVQRFQPEFGSTDDEDRDAELVLLEDAPKTIEEIAATCKRYKVKANVCEGDRLVGTVDAEGKWSASVG